MLGFSFSLSPGNPILNGSRATVLIRQPDGTVTVIALGTVWTAHLTREGDGTVTVSQFLNQGGVTLPPYYQVGASYWPIWQAELQALDATGGTASRSAMGASLTDSTKWYGGVLGPDGKIYGIPFNATDILMLSYVDSSVRDQLAMSSYLNKL